MENLRTTAAFPGRNICRACIGRRSGHSSEFPGLHSQMAVPLGGFPAVHPSPSRDEAKIIMRSSSPSDSTASLFLAMLFEGHQKGNSFSSMTTCCFLLHRGLFTTGTSETMQKLSRRQQLPCSVCNHFMTLHFSIGGHYHSKDGGEKKQMKGWMKVACKIGTDLEATLLVHKLMNCVRHSEITRYLCSLKPT